ncbi:MAG: radical SAM protein [Asgard group archaeon]|nr:radical SAM protein [Asgard group archaeon]
MFISKSKEMMTKSFEKTRYTFQKIPKMNFDKDYGIYMHVPFCYSKCTFCPFYKELFNEKLKNAYLEAIKQEIQQTPIKGEARWLYIGGGTPNTLTINELQRIITVLNKKTNIKTKGIELLPSLLTEEYLEGLKKISFTKISIGIETFSERVKRITARKSTTYQQIKKIVSHAKSLGLHVAVDLMVGLPEQSEKVFLDDIQKIGIIKPDQITIYPYMVIRGVSAKTSYTTKEQFQLIEKAAEKLINAGYNRKSVWIFVLPETQKEAIYDSSQDELIKDYCGFGPASFSTYGNWKVVKPELSVWLEDIRNGNYRAFVTEKDKQTDNWRRFANKIYDLKVKDDRNFPLGIRFFDFLLRLFGYYRHGYLTDKGRYFSHIITKGVVEALPFPIQNSKVVTNYEDYLQIKKAIRKKD